MQRSGVAFAWLMAAALLISACIPDATGAGPDSADKSAARTLPIVPVPAVIEEPPLTKTVREVLENGVLITISLASQQMHVFRNGVLWRSSPVSTGKRGKETPTGVFAILQKKKFHRSNLYSNAPMPFMQRLTWDGIAIHAGRLPGSRPRTAASGYPVPSPANCSRSQDRPRPRSLSSMKRSRATPRHWRSHGEWTRSFRLIRPCCGGRALPWPGRPANLPTDCQRQGR